MNSALPQLLAQRPDLAARLDTVRRFARRVRATEVHLTNACNLRCRGCWFFANDFDQRTREAGDADAWPRFARELADQGVTAPLLIGGEPTLFPDRVQAFVDVMPYVTLSSNGLRPFPREGFADVNVALTVFGGGTMDDALRGWAPSGRRIQGLLDTALANYRDDDRAVFIYILHPDARDDVADTVRRIEDNGNVCTFGSYSDYDDGVDDPAGRAALVDTALEVAARHPDTVLSPEPYIRAVITGETSFGRFGYDVCPSLSVDHPAHAERLANGNPVLPGFNVWSADRSTLATCCTSGSCATCRDSQAVYSWLLVSLPHFTHRADALEDWLDIAESYWRQFVWSPFHRRAARLQRGVA
ncbi:MAG: radical SAM protein [Alphaproteobacteria bacterium]|nr:radical SAM protein [Alphaproteobacteria bacterium]